jgi:hypothetical protein
MKMKGTADSYPWDEKGIAMIMEEVSTSKTSVNFYQTTRRNNPEDSRLLCLTCL